MKLSRWQERGVQVGKARAPQARKRTKHPKPPARPRRRHKRGVQVGKSRGPQAKKRAKHPKPPAKPRCWKERDIKGGKARGPQARKRPKPSPRHPAPPKDALNPLSCQAILTKSVLNPPPCQEASLKSALNPPSHQYFIQPSASKVLSKSMNGPRLPIKELEKPSSFHQKAQKPPPFLKGARKTLSILNWLTYKV